MTTAVEEPLHLVDTFVKNSMLNSVLAHASCRVDLAGSTLDIWPLYLYVEKAVTVNFAVDIATQCEIRPNTTGEIVLTSVDTGKCDRFAGLSELHAATRFDHALAVFLVRQFMPDADAQTTGFTMVTNSMSPAGAGISGSSALMVASASALARFTGQKIDREQIRVIAQNVEAQLIRVPTGCQDYYPALYGGVSAIHLLPEGIRREALAVAPEEIEQRFVVAYTGAPRQSGINNWEVFKSFINGDKHVQRNFREIAGIANGMRNALNSADWPGVTKLLRDEWKLRKTNAPGITTPLIDRLIEVTRKKGAVAAKVCGAGGGGCVVFQIEPGSRKAVNAAIEEQGARVLPFNVARHGVQVEVQKAKALAAQAD